MNRRWAGAAIAVAVAVLLLASYWLFRQGKREAAVAEAPSSSSLPASSAPVPEGETWTAELYFPAATDRLMAQQTPVTSAGSARARATGVVQSLLATPPTAPRVPVFPTEVKLGKLLMLEDGTVIIDLRTDPVAEPPQSGSTVEELRIYAIVDSVLHNVAEAKQVVLLWNGTQRPSFSGHIDTGHPLRLRADLVSS
ncbi:MAG: GerMN domain-containing protein [Thermoanaerobaculia bacterium]